MKCDYVMANLRNGDKVTLSFAKPQDVMSWIRVEMEEKMKDISTISFHHEGKVVLSMTFFV